MKHSYLETRSRHVNTSFIIMPRCSLTNNYICVWCSLSACFMVVVFAIYIISYLWCSLLVFFLLPIHFMFVVLNLFFGNVCGVHHSFKALWCSPLHRAGLVLFRGLADCAPAQTDGGEPAWPRVRGGDALVRTSVVEKLNKFTKLKAGWIITS
jgi:hypothetical protein